MFKFSTNSPILIYFFTVIVSLLLIYINAVMFTSIDRRAYINRRTYLCLVISSMTMKVKYRVLGLCVYGNSVGIAMGFSVGMG